MMIATASAVMRYMESAERLWIVFDVPALVGPLPPTVVTPWEVRSMKANLSGGPIRCLDGGYSGPMIGWGQQGRGTTPM